MNAKSFLNPADEYREVPFWSWNDNLDPDELRRQIQLMKQGGWGGWPSGRMPSALTKR